MDQPPVSDIKSKKRKRRAQLSCNDCRRRKLKCDRELPCDRCIKCGSATACAYDPETNPAVAEALVPDGQSIQHIVTQVPLLSEGEGIAKPKPVPYRNREDLLKLSKDVYIERLERRVLFLENSLLSRTEEAKDSALPQPSQRNYVSSKESKSAGGLVGLFKGQNYCTFAYGATSPITIVVHFPQLRPFMKETYPDSTLGHVQNDIKALEDRMLSLKASNRVRSIPTLRSLLPDRPTVDILISQYINTFETTYRILHIPSFLADYKKFWNSDAGSNSSMEAIVLAVIACVLCTSTHVATKHNPNGSTFRSKAIIWIKACEIWLKRQSNKHRSLASLQVRCLRLLALKTTCMKTKEYYQETQAHVGFMKAIGLHRDPATLKGRCTVFEGEIRRRLFVTSLELELQASIDRGTPSVFSGFEYDCKPPRNIDDSELSSHMQQLPTPQPISIFTDSSFSLMLMQSAALRIKLCALTNQLHSSLGLEEILEYEVEVLNALSDLPPWTNARSFQAWTHLDLQLRQFLMILHTHRTLQAHSGSKPDHRYSILACLEAATTSISRHIALLDSGNFVLCCIRSDYYRAALLISHIAYYASKNQDHFILRVVQPLFDEALENALRLLEERCTRPGRGNKQFWYISAAASLARIQFDPSRAETLRQQAADRVARMLYKILSLQEDPVAEDLASEIILLDHPTPTEIRIPATASTETGLVSATPASAEELRLDGFDLGTTSDWMLDDFYFFNDFPPLEFST